MTIKKLTLVVIGLILFVSCKTKTKEWTYSNTIHLVGIAPIGMITAGDNFWLSDVDHDRLVKIDKTGKVLQEITGLVRPMHIARDGDNIYIPQFGADNVVTWNSTQLNPVEINDSLDAPGGVGVGNGMIAVADFFNHRVLVITPEKSFTIGKEGHDNGSLYYPTDVEIDNDYLYIADAYNNRVEVYDHRGIYVRTIGWQEDIKVAAGVGIGNRQIFIVDFHGNRLLIYDEYGKLLATFNEHLDNPTDVLMSGNKLYVSNFRGNSISIFEYK